MVDNNWVLMGVGFIVGVVCVYSVCDLIFPVRKE
jgi:hypothetical protein